MDEYIDILDALGNLTGERCLKSVAHQQGFYHATVHVWFYTSDRKILLQKRGALKKTYPNRWDVSVAGHVQAGESIEEAALREVAEEIGLTIQKEDLRKIAVRKGERSHPNGILDNEFYHVFVVELTKGVDSLKKQDSEIDDLQLFDLSLFKNSDIPSLVPNTQEYYRFIYDILS
jgi:isopentenyldiphosphate isomerase